MTPLETLCRERITVHPAIMVGKPVVTGTRVPVERVLESLAVQPDLAELFAAYPRLTVDDVRACLAYAWTAVATQRRRAPLWPATRLSPGAASQPNGNGNPKAAKPRTRVSSSMASGWEVAPWSNPA